MDRLDRVPAWLESTKASGLGNMTRMDGMVNLAVLMNNFWKSNLKERDILNSDGIQKKKKAKKDKYNRWDILMKISW